MRVCTATLILGSFVAFAANAQSVISAHSGVVHYVEGNASIEDKTVELKFGHFPEIKANETFRTDEGRAEVLLTPGSFLRLAENSAVRMISNQLTDTRFELLKGEILVESVDWTKDSAAAKVKGNVISVLYKGTTTLLDKPGLYQFNTDPGRVRVVEGEALVKTGSDQLTLKKGKETELDGTLMAEKFDAKTGDDLIRWSARRSGYLATANVSAARSMNQNDSMWSSYAGGSGGGWAFNPAFGMYTFVPMGGIAYSPFGFNYWSPYTVGSSYPYYGGYGGYGGGYYYPGNNGGGGGGTVSQPISGNRGGNSSLRPNSGLQSSAASYHSRTPVGGGFSGGTSAAPSSSGVASSSGGGWSGASSSGASRSGGASPASAGRASSGGGGSRGGRN
jgi:hypothetical protein